VGAFTIYVPSRATERSFPLSMRRTLAKEASWSEISYILSGRQTDFATWLSTTQSQENIQIVYLKFATREVYRNFHWLNSFMWNASFCKTFNKLFPLKYSAHCITLHVSTDMLIMRFLRLLLDWKFGVSVSVDLDPWSSILHTVRSFLLLCLSQYAEN
jgi:hypothetical protein